MNGINTITVKNETSVAKYAAQYTNGEHVTLITKDGIKYYTDGKGGYYMLENNIVNNPDDDAINKPAEEQVDLMTKLKKIAENYDALAKITVVNGKLCFDGKEVAVGETVIPETPGKEPEDKPGKEPTIPADPTPEEPKDPAEEPKDPAEDEPTNKPTTGEDNGKGESTDEGNGEDDPEIEGQN